MKLQQGMIITDGDNRYMITMAYDQSVNETYNLLCLTGESKGSMVWDNTGTSLWQIEKWIVNFTQNHTFIEP